MPPGTGREAAARAQPGPARTPVVVTPDAVGLDLEVATVGSRAVAYLLDLLLLVVGFVLLGIAEVTFGLGGFVPEWFAIALLLLLLFAWQFGYPVGFETLWRGRTLGKAVMGLRVVTVEGGPVGVRHATIRAAVGLFELTATLGAGAVITSFVSSRGQRLGDIAAGTLVVRERRAAGDPQAEVFRPPHGLESYVGQLDVSALAPGDYAAVRDTLRRAPQLPPDTRTRITNQLAQTLLVRVTPPPPAGVTAEAWLTCVAAAVQARRVSTGLTGRPATPSWPADGGPAPHRPAATLPGAGWTSAPPRRPPHEPTVPPVSPPPPGQRPGRTEREPPAGGFEPPN